MYSVVLSIKPNMTVQHSPNRVMCASGLVQCSFHTINKTQSIRCIHNHNRTRLCAMPLVNADYWRMFCRVWPMQINMKSLPFNQCFEEREISIMIIRHNEIKRLSCLRAIVCVPEFGKYINVKIHLPAELDFHSSRSS